MKINIFTTYNDEWTGEYKSDSHPQIILIKILYNFKLTTNQNENYYYSVHHPKGLNNYTWQESQEYREWDPPFTIKYNEVGR